MNLGAPFLVPFPSFPIWWLEVLHFSHMERLSKPSNCKCCLSLLMCALDPSVETLGSIPDPKYREKKIVCQDAKQIAQKIVTYGAKVQFYKCKRKKKYFLSYPFRIAPLHPRLPKFHNVQNAPCLTSSANKIAPTSFAPPSQISQCNKCHMYFQKEVTKRNVCKSFFHLEVARSGLHPCKFVWDAFFLLTITGMVRSVIGMSFIL